MATSDDTIYIASNDQKLTVVDPVTLAQVATVNVGVYPIGVAVHPDDTVYVVNANADTMTVIAGRTLTVDQTIAVPDEPQAVAVSRVSDDTLFISSRGASHAITSLSSRTLVGAVSTSVGITNPTPFGLGLTSDDTAFIAAWPTAPRQFNSTSRVVTDLNLLSTNYIGVAVSSDDTVYMTNEGGSGSVVSFKATTPGTFTTIPVASGPQGIAVGHDGTVYVANRSADKVTSINPVTNQVDDSVNAGNGPYGIAVTRTGLVVTTNRDESRAQIIARLSPALTTPTAFAGDIGSLTINGLPTGVTVDDSTVTSIAFGDDTVAWARTPGTNTFSGAIPTGSGNVDVIVSLRGGNRAYAGTFAYAVPPPPPPTPADPPGGAAATAGDATATVSWTAPTSSGSYPISTYQATASPGGRSCLTSTLTCTVAGLTNGTAYTFTVRALSGAGWSMPSAPSDAVTPQAPPRPTITITGSRTGREVTVTGSTTGFGMGARLSPWARVDRNEDYRRGKVTVLVAADGTFTWRRRAPAGAELQVYFTSGTVRSNTVLLPSP